jgi:hypothetical protein
MPKCINKNSKKDGSKTDKFDKIDNKDGGEVGGELI